MAEEKKTPEKVQQGWFGKLINWFKNLPGNIAKLFKNMVAELRKVTWPSKKKLISSCITVLLFMLLMGIVVGLLDMGSNAAVDGLNKLGDKITATATPVPTAEPTAEPEGEVEAEVNEDATVETETEPAVETTEEAPADATAE